MQEPAHRNPWLRLTYGRPTLKYLELTQQLQEGRGGGGCCREKDVRWCLKLAEMSLRSHALAFASAIHNRIPSCTTNNRPSRHLAVAALPSAATEVGDGQPDISVGARSHAVEATRPNVSRLDAPFLRERAGTVAIRQRVLQNRLKV